MRVEPNKVSIPGVRSTQVAGYAMRINASGKKLDVIWDVNYIRITSETGAFDDGEVYIQAGAFSSAEECKELMDSEEIYYYHPDLYEGKLDEDVAGVCNALWLMLVHNDTSWN